jgi:cytochrome c oxidase subunit IV
MTMASQSEHGHGNAVRVYTITLAVLLFLTFITVAIAQVDFGNFNLVVAMLIATVKATIVGLVFMHLRYEHPLIWFYAAIPLFVLAIMLAGIFLDNPFRTNVTSSATVTEAPMNSGALH